MKLQALLLSSSIFLLLIFNTLFSQRMRIRGFFVNSMRYINLRFTYLLAYLLTYYQIAQRQILKILLRVLQPKSA